MTTLITDKTVNVLTFVDIINTKHAKRNIFILTPERAKELFKFKEQLDMELLLFDEAQLSDEDGVRGLYFDSIVRRVQKAFPRAKCVFAHPFVSNPEAQLQKNAFNLDESSAFKYEQKNVGQIFFAHDGTSYFHFGLNTELLGKLKIESDFDPVMRAIHTGGSVLIYTTKSSIYDKSIFEKFKCYIDECKPIADLTAINMINQLRKYIGANDGGKGYYYSNMLDNLKRGVVIHHGSLPLQARLILEHFTQKGFCRICFATSTLEQGINMPFDVVYLNTFHASKTLSMKNLIGRAGRSTTLSKFDYGSVVVKVDNMSAFRNVMAHDEVLNTVSLLDTVDADYTDYKEFKDAINSGEFSDEYNLPNVEVQRLGDDSIHDNIKRVLDAMFHGESLIALEEINRDADFKMKLYGDFRELYRFYLDGRSLSDGEESVLNTAIKILIWKVHCKTFKAICWYRYAFAARVPEHRALVKQYNSTTSIPKKSAIREEAINLNARFIRGFDDLPRKDLPNYSIYERGTKVGDVDYDRIVFDTYDYLDKLIGFKLSDIFYAVFNQYYQSCGDLRAFKLARYFKYGTDSEPEIWMLRYGLSFENIEAIKPYIVSINQEEIVFSPRVFDLPTEQLSAIERFIQ